MGGARERRNGRVIQRRDRPPFSPGHDEYHRPFLVQNAERAKASGDTAFQFWYAQRTIPFDMLSRRTKIGVDRLLAFGSGAEKPTAEEANVLAALLKCQSSDLLD